MGKQFDNVPGRYGAPMGRADYGNPGAPRSVRVFAVNLDSGGYDDGGAYWGHHATLYCATDGADYRAFTRARSRAEAVSRFEIAPEYLARGIGADIAKMRETEAGYIYITAGRPYMGTATLEKLKQLGY